MTNEPAVGWGGATRQLLRTLFGCTNAVRLWGLTQQPPKSKMISQCGVITDRAEAKSTMLEPGCDAVFPDRLLDR